MSDNQQEKLDSSAQLDQIMKALADAHIEWSVNYGRGYPVVNIQVDGFSIHLPDLDDLTLTTGKLTAALTEGYDRVMRYREAARDGEN